MKKFTKFLLTLILCLGVSTLVNAQRYTDRGAVEVINALKPYLAKGLFIKFGSMETENIDGKPMYEYTGISELKSPIYKIQGGLDILFDRFTDFRWYTSWVDVTERTYPYSYKKVRLAVCYNDGQAYLVSFRYNDETYRFNVGVIKGN